MPAAGRVAHELWCPPGTPLDAVQRLVLARYPAATLDGPDRVLTRHSRLSAPERDDRDHLVWTARTLRERSEPPWPGQTDPNGLYRAFAGGMPVLEERRVLDLLIGVARRCGGSLVVDAEGEHPHDLPVDRWGRLDLRLLSPVELDPHQVLAAVSGVEPTARLAMGGFEFEPAPMDTDDLPQLVREMSRHERLEVTAYSQLQDETALGGPDLLDAFAVQAPLGGFGTLVVEAHAEDDLPALVRLRGWPGVVGYDVRWLPVDPSQAETDRPDEAFRAARVAVRPRVRAVTRAVAELAPGEVLDADGLPVDRYAL